MLDEQNSVIVSLNPVGIQDVHAASDRLDYIAKIWTFLENLVFSVKTLLR